MGREHPALTYASYLALDEILGAQRPRSDEHDEMLFIVVHQVYELWFKQLIHELCHLQQRLEAGDTARSVRTLTRILTILKLAVAQIDVLETMAPHHFTAFRTRLDAASGFQSAQFRELEAILGVRDPRAAQDHPEGSPARQRILAAFERPPLYESFLAYLRHRGFVVPDRPSPAIQATLLEVYRLDGEEATVAEKLVDLDEGVQEWRYRHVKMVERTIGDKTGTGGSAGVAYLRGTLFKPLFPDLWTVRSSL